MLLMPRFQCFLSNGAMLFLINNLVDGDRLCKEDTCSIYFNLLELDKYRSGPYISHKISVLFKESKCRQFYLLVCTHKATLFRKGSAQSVLHIVAYS